MRAKATDSRVRTLYRRRARGEDLSFVLNLVGIAIVMAQIYCVENAAAEQLLNLQALPLAAQAERLRGWRPPPEADGLLNLSLRLGLWEVTRAEVTHGNNCSRFANYYEVEDGPWCTRFTMNGVQLHPERSAGHGAAAAERSWKVAAVLLQLLTSVNAIALVALVVVRFVVNAQILDARGLVHRSSVDAAAGSRGAGRRGASLRVALACGATKRNRMRLLRLGVELLLAGFHVPAFVSDYYIPGYIWVANEDRGADVPLLFHYHATDLNILLWLRLVWPLFRTLRNRSVFSGSEQARALANKLEESGSDAVQRGNAAFAFKMMFRQQPSKLITLLAIFTTVACASTLWTFEKACPHGINGFTDCLWLTLVTMSSVGYGDLYAVTVPGKVTLFFGGASPPLAGRTRLPRTPCACR